MVNVNRGVALLTMVVSAPLLASNFDDATIKESLAKSVRYLHSDMTDYVQSSALEGCDYDTNRFLRLVKEVAQEYANVTWSMLLLIGKYGTTNDLDFASAYLKSADAGRGAVGAYYGICGLSSNYVSSVVEFVAEDSHASNEDKLLEIELLMSAFRRGEAAQSLQDYAHNVAIGFAVSATNNICAIDRRILPFYPSYSNSVERLTILTNAVARGVNEYELRYLTNAIHHIELP